MNLEEMNKQYLELKKKLEEAREEIEKMEVEVADLASDKAIAEQQQAKAKRAGNKADETKYKKEAEAATKKLEEAKKKAESKKASLKTLQEKIDEKIKEIKENPEMAAHFDEVMKKRTERQYLQNRKKLEELTEKKEKLETIQKLATEHPSLANNLTGMLVASKQIRELNAELESLVEDPNATPKKYKDPARAAEIRNKLLPAAELKMKDNKEPFLQYCEKHKIKIDEKDIEDLLSGRVIEDNNGNIDLKTTLNARIGSVNRQIKSANKIMDNSAILNRTIREEEAAREEETNNGGNEEKPKWWQFIKRFKNWNERRKQAKLQDEFERDDDEEEEPAGGTSEEEHSEEETHREENKNEFRDSLKYDIVRDALNQTIKEKIAEARREMEERHEEEQPEQEEDDREP